MIEERGEGGIDQPVELSMRSQVEKIKPEYTHGELVKVGWGKNQSEAEMVQLMLLEEGIPTTVRRSAGFDVPDFLAAGPRDVLAPTSAAEAAWEVLHAADLVPSDRSTATDSKSRALRLFIGVLIVFLGLGAAAIILTAQS